MPGRTIPLRWGPWRLLATVAKPSPDMRPPLNDYLTASSRDFIALFRRS